MKIRQKMQKNYLNGKLYKECKFYGKKQKRDQQKLKSWRNKIEKESIKYGKNN